MDSPLAATGFDPPGRWPVAVPRRLLPIAEFGVVTLFNACTLGAAIVLFAAVAGIGSRSLLVLASHATSAVLSYLFCSLVVWARPGEPAGVRLARAGAFFGLAAVSAAASLVVTVATQVGARSLLFLALNYGAVGTIAVAKFAAQRWAMTRRRAAHGRAGARLDCAGTGA